MRVIKDKEEISKIRHAAQISCQALLSFIPQLRQAKSERHAAKLLEGHFTRLGAEGPSFPTIIASGRHATVLHHTPTFHPLWKREPVLIDAGAVFKGYAADITRCIPVSGRFSEAQARIYDLVHAALLSGIEKALPGSSLNAVHAAVVRTITAGLVDLGLLQGKVPELILNKAYARYFMHRSGHWLGLDVHDISPIYCDDYLIPPYDRPFEAGNVFTIEPGLYFDPSAPDIPEEYRGIGIRLEEDILITNRSSEILTSHIPVSREDIESLAQL
jgi:Xaa-Pro aminopeptidase